MLKESKPNGYEIGTRVQTMQDWPGVPKFTEGLIIEDYGTGVTVAWNRPHNPLPDNMTPQEIAAMYAINPSCPLRDGFSYDELSMLVIIKD